MSSSDVEIANLALGHIGVAQTIQDLDTDTSNEAKAINRYYKPTRKEVLGEYDWPFASKTVTMTELSTDPTTEWGYEYQYPPNCVKFIKIISGTRTDTEDSFEPYEIVSGTSDTVIYTDVSSAVGKFTALITDENLYPLDFVMAFAFRLAFYIAPTLMTGDPFKLREAAGQFALVWINKAAARGYNESMRELTQSRYVRGRT